MESISKWLDARSVSEGSPCLFAPDGGYDLELNRYFEHSAVRFRSRHTAAAVAYDLADFLTFLWWHREPVGGGTWKDATPADRAAYLHWRRKDPDGPRVAGSTWSRSVATVNAFYVWAVAQGYVASNPILQREVKSRRGRRATPAAQTPAEAARDARRRDTRWLPPESYRQWRDVGVRGYLFDGTPDTSFKGRNAARNTAFCDLMIRTGLRLEEQSSLTLFDLPDPDASSAMRPIRLPSSIAKGGIGPPNLHPVQCPQRCLGLCSVRTRRSRFARSAAELLCRRGGPTCRRGPQAPCRSFLSRPVPPRLRRVVESGGAATAFHPHVCWP